MPEEQGAVREAAEDAVLQIPEAEAEDTTPAQVERPPLAGKEERPPLAPHRSSPARRRAIMPWAVVGGLLVTLGAIAIGLTYTPMFHAKHITVAGERHLSEARVLQIAGIGPGTDLFHLDVGSVERRLERNPWIADAAVVRRLPSSVTVTVTERHPVGLTRSADGHVLYVANDGGMLGQAPGTPLLPEISTAEPSSMAAAASVAQALPASLRPVVASIAVDGFGSVTLTTRPSVTATYGDASEARAKGEALKAVLDYAASEGKTLLSVDVEVPGAPTAVFAGTVEASPNPRP